MELKDRGPDFLRSQMKNTKLHVHYEERLEANGHFGELQ